MEFQWHEDWDNIDELADSEWADQTTSMFPNSNDLSDDLIDYLSDGSVSESVTPSSPVESNPVESSPVESSPVESSPVESTPSPDIVRSISSASSTSTVSGKGSPNTTLSLPNDKEARTREKNRKAAQRSREKRKREDADMEVRNKELKRLKSELKKDVQPLEINLKFLEFIVCCLQNACPKFNGGRNKDQSSMSVSDFTVCPEADPIRIVEVPPLKRQRTNSTVNRSTQDTIPLQISTQMSQGHDQLWPKSIPVTDSLPPEVVEFVERHPFSNEKQDQNSSMQSFTGKSPLSYQFIKEYDPSIMSSKPLVNDNSSKFDLTNIDFNNIFPTFHHQAMVENMNRNGQSPQFSCWELNDTGSELFQDLSQFESDMSSNDENICPNKGMELYHTNIKNDSRDPWSVCTNKDSGDGEELKNIFKI